MHWVTEDEAARMMCPLLTPHPLQRFTCIGSECMAWRWRDERNTADKAGTCNWLQRRCEAQEPTRFSR